MRGWVGDIPKQEGELRQRQPSLAPSTVVCTERR